jgi:hypothetical protein
VARGSEQVDPFVDPFMEEVERWVKKPIRSLRTSISERKPLQPEEDLIKELEKQQEQIRQEIFTEVSTRIDRGFIRDPKSLLNLIQEMRQDLRQYPLNNVPQYIHERLARRARDFSKQVYDSGKIDHTQRKYLEAEIQHKIGPTIRTKMEMELRLERLVDDLRKRIEENLTREHLIQEKEQQEQMQYRAEQERAGKTTKRKRRKTKTRIGKTSETSTGK